MTKRAKQVIIIPLIILAVLILAGFTYTRYMLFAPLPDYNEDIELKNLEEAVKVYRDAYGNPHIYAKTELDVYRATGYLMAEDRLWQMDVYRRATQGRLSEIFGEDLLQADELLRTLRITEKTDQILQNTPEQVKGYIQAYADGINQYIETHEDNLPLEFQLLGYEMEPWEARHSVNMATFFCWALNMAWTREVLMYQLSQLENISQQHFLHLLPSDSLAMEFTYDEYDPSDYIDQETLEKYFSKTILYSQEEAIDDLSLLDSLEALRQIGVIPYAGSNNWVVSGERSTTGAPVLTNDMHLEFRLPGYWYQIHQVVEGGLNISGVILAGSPFVFVGHNENIAWGLTVSTLDTNDFYFEKINDQNEYLYKNEWYPMEIITTKIALASGESVERNLRYTRTGAIITKFKEADVSDDIEISMRWSGHESTNELLALYRLNKAANWEQFREAVQDFKSMGLNLNYADVQGNIGLQNVGAIPIRSDNSGWEIHEAWTGQHDWLGFVPFEELPFSFNPSDGFLGSANSYQVKNYPYYLSQWYLSPYRVARIHQYGRSMDQFSMEDHIQMQLDIKSTMVQQFRGRLMGFISNQKDKLNEIELEALKLMEDWEGSMAVDQSPPMIFDYLYLKLIKNIFSDEMGGAFYNKWLAIRSLVNQAFRNVFYANGSPWFDDITTPDVKESFEDITLLSFHQTIEELADQFGSDCSEWKWGDLHSLPLKHALSQVKVLDWIFGLNRGSYPIGGSDHTLYAFSYDYNHPFEVGWGVSQRLIYDLGDWDNSISILPDGISGQPGSDHYGDQTEAFLQGRFNPEYFSREKVESVAQYERSFSPKPE